MTLMEWLKVKKTLWIMATQQGCTMAQIRQDIQESIDDAWNRAWTPGNIEAQVNWQLMFPGGIKPSVEEFVVVMARKITNSEEFLHLLE